MMRCRHSSTRRYVHSKDLEQEVRCSGAMERQSVCSNLPSDSSPHSDGHMPSLPALIALKLSRNDKHKLYDALTAHWSMLSLGSPSITPKPL